MRALKIGLVIVVATVVTALGIDAADTLQGSRSTLLAQLAGSENMTACPEGMIEVKTGVTFSCVDKYEAAPSEACPYQTVLQALNTADNIAKADCTAVARKDAVPWRSVTREQAAQLCARSGKRLPTAAEWYQFSIDTKDDAKVCNINGKEVLPSGSKPECISAAGVFDTVGNAWEWVSDDVFDATYNGRPLPAEGYVSQVDSGGVAAATNEVDAGGYGSDYFWSKPEGMYGVMKGGYFGSGGDAGVYTTHAATDPNFVGTAIGFRCVQ